MPLLVDLVEGHSNRFLKSLVYTPLITVFLPVTGLCSGAVLLLYQYLRHEHLFNSKLATSTPPPPDAHLPSHEEWIANGGLKRVPSVTPANDEEPCIFCYSTPTDPTRIEPCGHIFCAECVDAWQTQGSNSCPQCTTILFRGEPRDYSQLEKLVKFVTAAGLVAVPMTIFTLLNAWAYYVRKGLLKLGFLEWILLLTFTALQFLILALIRGGHDFMTQRRREHGLKWWGDGVDAQIEMAYRMSMSTFSVVGSCWLLFQCVICEVSIGTFDPVFDILQAVVAPVLAWS